jgi:thiamine biosynthesis lipoprotein
MYAPVMGSTAHVVVPGAPELEVWALRQLRELEAKWSRFLPTSELSQLNSAAGRALVVSPETLAVLERAVAAWRWTDGLFDPTVHDALIAAGYDRTFSQVESDESKAADAAPVPGCAGIVLTRDGTTAALPPGTAIDLGGVAKGFAADIVLARLCAMGARGACVNVGGDIAVVGDAPTARGWIVGVDDPFLPGQETLQLAVRQGAVATSSRLKRRWNRGGVEMHHIIDSRTGLPATTSIVAVTVIAGSATDAEVLTKTWFLDADVASRLTQSVGASAIVVGEDRQLHHVGAVETFAA